MNIGFIWVVAIMNNHWIQSVKQSDTWTCNIYYNFSTETDRTFISLFTESTKSIQYTGMTVNHFNK